MAEKKKQIRDRFIKFRVNAEEEARVKQLAEQCGMSVSEYIRRRTIRKNFPPNRSGHAVPYEG